MSLQQDIMTALKEAMKSKDQIALTALRAVKSAILLAQTESGAKEDLTEEQELKILQKLVKQRKDSAAIIDQIGAEGMKDMGKVMGMVSKELAGQADGKTISSIVKAKLA